MKRQSAVGMLVMFCLMAQGLWAQSVHAIEVRRLPISSTKTTHLIFPYAIKSIDRGSGEVLVQKAPGVENVVQVKAAASGFAETNLTVMTADGRFYSYLLHYDEQSPELNVIVKTDAPVDESLVIFDPDATSDKVRAIASQVIDKRAVIHSCRVSRYKLQLSLEGLYAARDHLYFQLRLRNDSRIDYPVRQLRLFLKDDKTGKRTTIQEIELEPAYILGNQKVIHNQSAHHLVLALPIFTIPDHKRLIVELQETNGGRHLRLVIKGRQLMNALGVY